MPVKRVVIIGGGLGGLSAAIHLRLAGYEVRLYEQGPRTGGRANLIERDGFRFDTGPSLLNYPWVFRELFSAAGRRLEDFVELLKVDPGISYRWPDGRHLSLSSDFSTLYTELSRLDPQVGPRLLAWLAHTGENYRACFERLVPRNEDNPLRWIAGAGISRALRLGLQRSLYSELKRYFHSKHICQALGSYAMYLGGSPFKLPGLFGILPYGELADGLWLPRGGMYALVHAVEQLATELGVSITTGKRVVRIMAQDGRVAGVSLADGQVVPAEVVVSNCDVPTTNRELLPDSLAGRGQRQLRMTPGVVTFYWGIRGGFHGLGHHTIFFPADYRSSFNQLFTSPRLSEDPSFYVSVASAAEPQLAPAGDSAVFVLIPTPLLSQLGAVDWEAERARLKQHVLSRLGVAGVTLQPSQIVVEEFYNPVDWKAKFGLFDGSAFGAAHGLFELGPFRSRNYSRRLPGLYYVGASTTPGTGLPLVVIGGRMVAQRIISHER